MREGVRWEMELVSTNNLQESGKERKRTNNRRGERREGKEARKEWRGREERK